MVSLLFCRNEKIFLTVWNDIFTGRNRWSARGLSSLCPDGIPVKVVTLFMIIWIIFLHIDKNHDILILRLFCLHGFCCMKKGQNEKKQDFIIRFINK